MTTITEQSTVQTNAKRVVKTSSITPHASIPNQAYLLSATTIFKRSVFSNMEAARAAASVHTMRWVWRDSQVLAWVLLPDQWHGLVVLGQNDDSRKLMGRFKTATAKAIDTRYKKMGWLWGNGFREQALNQDVVLRDAGRHLVTQPIRAGLVDDIRHYPYWSAIWLETGNDHLAWPGSRR